MQKIYQKYSAREYTRLTHETRKPHFPKLKTSEIHFTGNKFFEKYFSEKIS